MIQQSTIDAVHAAINIVEIIGDYVKLKKRGANYVGLSPFSNERTASFTVSPVKNIFKCFSSGKGGNAVTFIMEIDSISYPEAIKFLAKKYGIDIEEDNVTDDQLQSAVLAEGIIKINERAAVYFQEQLNNSIQAWDYLKDRGFTKETVDKWQIGYSNDSGDSLASYMLKKSGSKEILLSADLCMESDRKPGKLRDKYIDRIMFPFHNLSGKITGFSGRQRVLNKDYPKYTNTKENEVFKKGSLLFGIYFAKKAIQKSGNCNIVEGQADVIKMHQYGFEDTVATGGTALTKEHVFVIKRFCSRMTFIYDGDEAGQKAISRGIEIAIEEGMSVDVLVLPTGEDPDSMLLKLGPEGFSNYRDAKLGDIVDFYMGDGVNIPKEQKDERGRTLLRLIALIGKHDIFRRRAKVNKLHKLFNADLVKINEAIDKIRLDGSDQNKVLNILYEKETVVKPYESEFVRTLLRYGAEPYNDKYPLVYLYMLNERGPEVFDTPVMRDIIQDYWDCIYAEFLPDLDRYLTHDNPDIASFATGIAFEDFSISNSWECVSDIRPDYKKTVRSVCLFFIMGHLRKSVEENELLLHHTLEQEKISEILEANNLIKSKIRKVAELAGVSYIK